MWSPPHTVEEHGAAWLTWQRADRKQAVLCPSSPPPLEAPSHGGEGQGRHAVSAVDSFLPLSTYPSSGGPLLAGEEGLEETDCPSVTQLNASSHGPWPSL